VSEDSDQDDVTPAARTKVVAAQTGISFAMSRLNGLPLEQPPVPLTFTGSISFLDRGWYQRSD
jgi:hypothetical protein